MRKLFFLLMVGTTILLTSCTTVRVSSDFDKAANFQQYQTYAFHAKGLADIKMNDLDKRRVVDAISTNLHNKGFQIIKDENQADVIVNIVAKTENRVEMAPWPWYNPWYGPWWGMWETPSMLRNYKDGTLVIDFVDRKTNTLVWQGMGEGIDLYRLTDKAERIPKAVTEILEKYPPQ